ncbi:MAG: aldehyde dehydrogenase family protein [Acidobacteria bacterium]|nr:aldehyde dehydrogenase family protein [Acidobacteriota bacterium]
MVHDQDLVSIQEVRGKVEKAYAAWQKFRSYTQEQVDAIVEAMGAAGRAHAQPLAEMAVEETSYGNVPDKLAKNLLCSDLLVRSIRGMKTLGILRELPEQKIVEFGVPQGVVAAIVPTTNPTSTVIYKAIVSLKAGNGVVISPHPHARKCTAYTAKLMAEAAVAAGAPEDIIQCLDTPTMEGTQALMRHDKIAVILATGGSGMVKAAYSSGKPAFGVGPGNVPVLVEKTADVADAVRKIVIGKSFDYGTVCSSEQSLVTCHAMKDAVVTELKKNRAYLCTEEQAKALGKLLVSPAGTINPRCVGQSPGRIAELAGFSVPPETSIIVAEIGGVGKMHPLSAEKLSPVLALYIVEGWEQALDTCEAILKFNGMGHTAVIHSQDETRIREFGRRMPAYRVMANTASPQGSVGITTNLQPSMTLGCGAVGGNSTSDNIGPQHLINIKRLAWAVRLPEEALQIPEVKTAARAAAPAAAAPAGIDRQTVAAAVEQYLAQKGFATSGAAKPAAPAVADVVDRFLAARRAAPPAPPVCASPATPPPAAPAPPVTVVDFVCESDVRDAMRQNRKIYIGPKTIVTPAAREAAAAGDVLVLAQR